MATTKKKKTQGDRWLELESALRSVVPHLFSVLGDEEDFKEIRFKLRDDRTTLAVLKVYGSDGGPMVCFGSGYGIVGSLMSVNASIAGNAWKPDKPWRPPAK